MKRNFVYNSTKILDYISDHDIIYNRWLVNSFKSRLKRHFLAMQFISLQGDDSWLPYNHDMFSTTYNFFVLNVCSWGRNPWFFPHYHSSGLSFCAVLCEVKGLSIVKTRFWPLVWGWWPRHVPTTWGWFWVHVRNTAHVRPWSKNGSKADHFDVVGCQNRIKNGRVIPIESWGKSGVLAYFLAENWLFWPNLFFPSSTLISRENPN